MGHANNARVISASKLLTGMGDFNAEYNPAETYSDFEQSGSENDVITDLAMPQPKDTLTAYASYASDNNFDSLCTPCISSKQTRVVVDSKPMTEVKEKLEEVHVDLWGPHNHPSISGKAYAAILLDAKTRKTWVIYLRSKMNLSMRSKFGFQRSKTTAKSP